MEKIIVIDGKSIPFKSTGAVPLRYKAQFQRDFYADLLYIIGKLDAKALEQGKQITANDVAQINFETFYNIAWTFAKTANKEIPPPFDWLDTFDEFPIMEILPELQDMLYSTIQSKKK